jgi:hypothetical protein
VDERIPNTSGLSGISEIPQDNRAFGITDCEPAPVRGERQRFCTIAGIVIFSGADTADDKVADASGMSRVDEIP